MAAHLLAHLPGKTQALCALMGMGSMLAGALGVPLTAVLFSLELTHALPAILPLVLACTASYLVTSLIMPRSILTVKLGRRGYHLSREYGVDPLELLTAVEVMAELPPGDDVMAGKPGSLCRRELCLQRRDVPGRGRGDGQQLDWLSLAGRFDREDQQSAGCSAGAGRAGYWPAGDARWKRRVRSAALRAQLEFLPRLVRALPVADRDDCGVVRAPR